MARLPPHHPAAACAQPRRRPGACADPRRAGVRRGLCAHRRRPGLGHDLHGAVHLPDRLHTAGPAVWARRCRLADARRGPVRFDHGATAPDQEQAAMRRLVAMLLATRGKGRLHWTDWASYLYLALGVVIMFG